MVGLAMRRRGFLHPPKPLMAVHQPNDPTAPPLNSIAIIRRRVASATQSRADQPSRELVKPRQAHHGARSGRQTIVNG